MGQQLLQVRYPSFTHWCYLRMVESGVRRTLQRVLERAASRHMCNILTGAPLLEILPPSRAASWLSTA